MNIKHKSNDCLEVLDCNQDGRYKVWSENDERIYYMSRTDIAHEESHGAEVVWDTVTDPRDLGLDDCDYDWELEDFIAEGWAQYG